METLGKRIKDQRVLILGFGREGQSTLNRLKKIGGYKSLGIADRNPVRYRDKEVTLHTGEAYLDCLEEYDLVVKTPGVVLPRSVEDYKSEIVSQTELFFECYREQIIGITGTKGKSTTASLLYHVLKTAGKDCILVGNIGIPAFDHMEEISDDTLIVFELSCHQLEFSRVSPHIAVLLNLHEEHLDHYGTMEKYVAAKENIFLHQNEQDLFFCLEELTSQRNRCKGQVITVGDDSPTARVQLNGSRIITGDHMFVIPVDETALIGRHNYLDAAFVYGVCQSLGVEDSHCEKGLITYKTLPHRLEYLGEIGGVKYYDDSISTIGDTTIQALKTLNDADTVLIGGMDRGIDYSDLIRFLSDHPIPNIILMEETGKRIYEEIMRCWPGFAKRERLILVDHLNTAVRKAREVTRQGRSCVLSPASASYGIFKNFEERGEAFARYIREV